MRTTFLIISFVLLTGCQTLNVKSGPENQPERCKYLKRDLTASWAKRSYWCVPHRLTKQKKSEVQSD